MSKYTNMLEAELYDELRKCCYELAEIACAMDKTMVLIANGKGNRPVFHLLDADPVKEMIS